MTRRVISRSMLLCSKLFELLGRACRSNAILCQRVSAGVDGGKLSLSKRAFVASTALMQLEPDGQKHGGSIRIADYVTISDGAILAPYGGSIDLEEGVFVGPYSVLYGHGGLTIGRNTLIAAHTVLIPANHIFEASSPIASQGLTKKGIKVGENVWLGTGVRVLDGVEIGNGCVVGAGSVVTKSLAPGCVAVGVPARVVRNRSVETNPRLK